MVISFLFLSTASEWRKQKKAIKFRFDSNWLPECFIKFGIMLRGGRKLSMRNKSNNEDGKSMSSLLTIRLGPDDGDACASDSARCHSVARSPTVILINEFVYICSRWMSGDSSSPIDEISFNKNFNNRFFYFLVSRCNDSLISYGSMQTMHLWRSIFGNAYVPCRWHRIDIKLEKSFTGTNGMLPLGRPRLLSFAFWRWFARAHDWTKKRKEKCFISRCVLRRRDVCMFCALAYGRIARYCIHTQIHRIFLRRETFVILMTNKRLEGGAKPIIFRTLLLIRTFYRMLCVLIYILGFFPNTPLYDLYE